jgi:hypothetical protein
VREDHSTPARFDATWTPTIVILDPDGVERHRIEGYMPNREFRSQLEMGLARTAFKTGRFEDAERLYGSVAEKYADAPAAPEALYWRAVSRYKGTGDPSSLGEVAGELARKHPGNEWTTKAGIWAQPAASSKAA